MTGGLCQLHTVADDGGEVPAREMLVNLIDDVSDKARSTAVKRRESANVDRVSGPPGQHVDRFEKLADAMQCKETRIDGHNGFR